MTTQYETDFHQWIQETVHYLHNRQFDAVDWENLIVEIEDMGKSQKRALESYLTRLLEHLLKLAYWESERDRSGKHWASEIVNFRYQIQKRLQESPSLKSALEDIYTEVFPVALKSVSQLFPVPSNAQISLKDALDDDWFASRSFDIKQG